MMSVSLKPGLTLDLMGRDSENSTISRVTNQANSSSLEGFPRMWTDVKSALQTKASFGDFKMYHSWERLT